VPPAPERFRIGGDLEVRRLGFGATRLCGARTPSERENALRVLRRAVELGVNVVDTAHAYVRTEVNERQIAEALHPYPKGLAIAPMEGCTRAARKTAVRRRCGRTARRACDNSARWQTGFGAQTDGSIRVARRPRVSPQRHGRRALLSLASSR
jgi:aryl-alcohol dehydrogenase-like predicted oxidoreductase